MKKIIMLLIASFAVGVAGQASAQSTQLTRGEVKQQLVQAESQGLVPSNGVNYPPNARAIARNKAAFQAREQSHASQASYGGVTEEHASN